MYSKTHTDIYKTVGLLILEGVVVVEGRSILFPSPYILINMHTYNHTYQPTSKHSFTFLDFFISRISRFPDLHKYGNARNTEIMSVCV